MHDIEVSDIVLSLAGHDGGKPYVVVGWADERVLLADGKVRKLQRPKRKSVKHISPAMGRDPSLADRLRSGDVTDRELRKKLAEYREAQSAEWRRE